VSERADVAVIGLGPGGEDLAGSLAEAGLGVIGIDNRLVGGECPYWGCVPSKMMIRAANLLAEARRIPGMAGDATVKPDWDVVARRIRDEATDDWNDKVAVERFEGKGGRFLRGTARIEGPGRVDVDGAIVEANKVVIAAGTAPAVPPIPGLAEVGYWTNHEAIEAKELPESIIVMGGGAVGAELGQVFARFGSRVTIVEALDRLLPPEEPEAGDLIKGIFEGEGINVRTGAEVVSVSRRGPEVVVTLDGGDSVSGRQILVATGRRADLKKLGVGSIGIDESARGIPVDEYMRAAENVWAIGDITGIAPFTHISMYQANIARASILGEDVEPADYKAVPRVTFTDPEVGSVGVTEKAALDRGLHVHVGSGQIPHSARGWIHKAGNEGFIKLVMDQDRRVLIGATSAGPHGGEVLSMLTLAVKEEIPIDNLRTMIYAYPTFHRAVEDALRNCVDARATWEPGLKD
jgi:pyruvate/2-oxoglutarate dehydrogenase complex dihydrolipoamide dehydrogenase (E3) component